jgi:hypothetical protein
MAMVVQGSIHNLVYLQSMHQHLRCRGPNFKGHDIFGSH